MNLLRTRLRILREPKDLSSTAKTGVSLHCHTEVSKEMLDFIPFYAEKMPVISYFWKREQVRYREREGKEIDFSNSYWSPPMTPQGVYDIEKNQINQAGLGAIVSLTDHDNINGNFTINDSAQTGKIPVSMEWTVPFEYGFFHVGVHNLPRDRADEIAQDLLGYTFDKERHSTGNLNDLFSLLSGMPEVLVVLNHPIWDIERVGAERHAVLLKSFIREHGRWIHAFEINGFRTWSENKAVIEMAEALGIPIVTGGDRHGCQPNTVINLTKTGTFEEFVEEIRVEKRSEVVLMPEYEAPLHSRQMQSFSEILTYYPDFAEHRRRWFDRIFFDTGDGMGVVPLSAHGWRLGGPKWLRMAIKVLGFLGKPSVRPLFRVLRKAEDRVPKDVSGTKFDIPDLDDLSRELSTRAVSPNQI
jgi:hypothetical protein